MSKRGRPPAPWDERLAELSVHLKSQPRPRMYLAGVLGWEPLKVRNVLRYGLEIGAINYTGRGRGTLWGLVHAKEGL